MDIFLQGEKDGVTAAEEIKKTTRLPIIYITAHSYDKTIKRAISG